MPWNVNKIRLNLGIFRTSANDIIQSRMIVDEAITRRGFKKPAILADSTNYGQLGREDLEKALAVKGIKPVTEEKFNIGDTDMTSQLLRAKAGASSTSRRASFWPRGT